MIMKIILLLGKILLNIMKNVNIINFKIRTIRKFDEIFIILLYQYYEVLVYKFKIIINVNEKLTI